MTGLTLTANFRHTQYSVEVDSAELFRNATRRLCKVMRINYTRVRLYYVDAKGNRKYIEPTKHIEKYRSKFVDGTMKVHVKDIGPQVGYKSVFITEYVGPLVIWVAMLAYSPHKGLYTDMATALWCWHYTKRLFETLFVHKFSHATMPVLNLFRNCLYYYVFAALIAHDVLFSQSQQEYLPFDRVTVYLSRYLEDPRFRYILAVVYNSLHILASARLSVILFALFEGLNLYCHLKLRWLRPHGSSGYYLPRGFLFDYICCPNYTTEILSWVCFTWCTRSVASGAFTIVGAVQMYFWAAKKQQRLVQQFGEAKNRGKLLPKMFVRR